MKVVNGCRSLQSVKTSDAVSNFFGHLFLSASPTSLAKLKEAARLILARCLGDGSMAQHPKMGLHVLHRKCHVKH